MEKSNYLLHLQFLGFRYHGWQKQPDVKTVQFMLERTLITVLGHDQFKVIGTSRTDSMVSSLHHLSQLTVPSPIEDKDKLIEDLNLNLPQDMRALKLEVLPPKFNPLSSKKFKEYHYYFSFGAKTHPFCAPLMTNFLHQLDIPLMQAGAKLFEGEHNFIKYCFRGSENKQYTRKIEKCVIEENKELTASFFPEKSYVLKLASAGFMRNQVRIIMGTLFALGQNQICLEDIQKSLLPSVSESNMLGFVAPASGLILYKSEFID